LWQRLRLPLPIELFVGRAEVVHGPDFILPPVLGARRVVTIHDLAFLTHPDCALPSLIAYLTPAVARALRSADPIITVSPRTADDLAERLAVPPEKIRVIHLGLSPSFTPSVDAATIETLRTRYGLRRPLVLAVGTIEPRKNYETLIAAFAAARHALDGPEMLALAGRRGWLYEGVYRAAQM